MVLTIGITAERADELANLAPGLDPVNIHRGTEICIEFLPLDPSRNVLINHPVAMRTYLGGVRVGSRIADLVDYGDRLEVRAETSGTCLLVLEVVQ